MSGSGAGSSSDARSGAAGFFRSQQDLEYLAELLRDFGVEGHPAPEEALRLLFDRWQAFDTEVGWLAEEIKLEARDRDVPLAKALKELGCKVHHFLYDEILSNAGQLRKSTDPGAGSVYFGGQKGQTHASLFTGTHPDLIEVELDKAYSYLTEDGDPVHASCCFYLELSAVHPFYDANGRVGRAIVSVYLLGRGYYINWSQIDASHAKFIKKLNECIKRRNRWQQQFLEYREFLLAYWKKHVQPLPSFYDIDFGED